MFDLPWIVVDRLYAERDLLVCGRKHPLYDVTDNLDLFD